MKSSDAYFARMCDSAAKITRAVSGHTEESFVESETATASVILWLAQIGETAKRTPSETLASFDLPWKDITGFRDLAVHEYFDLDLHDVWLTATHDIPELIRVLHCGTNSFKGA